MTEYAKDCVHTHIHTLHIFKTNVLTVTLASAHEVSWLCRKAYTFPFPTGFIKSLPLFLAWILPCLSARKICLLETCTLKCFL